MTAQRNVVACNVITVIWIHGFFLSSGPATEVGASSKKKPINIERL